MSALSRRNRIHVPRVLWAAIVTFVCALAVPALASAQTVVSLQFDDGLAQQYPALSLLNNHGMHGTFFVNSGVTGVNSANMTWPQLHDLASAGNEIGGHTIAHADLTTVSSDEAQREICNDRNNLLAQGFSPTDFAYPYGAYNSTDEQLVKQCGYNSGRQVGGLNGSADGCSQNCVWAESLSPPDRYATREHESILYNTSLATIESYVTDAEQHGGGWVQLIFHHICTTTCDPVTDLYGITQANFTALLDWLQPRAASGTVVKTVNQVIGGPVNPAVQAPAAAPASGSNYVVNPSFETLNPATGSPYCYQLGQFGSSTASWGQVSTAHTGSAAGQLQVSNFSSGDAKIITQQDLGECSRTLAPGARYQVSAWYKSSAPTVFELYTRNAVGGWSYWTQSVTLPASSAWSQVTFTAPALPSGATGLSFGLALLSNGTLTVDDYAMAPAPTVGPGGNTLQNASLESVGANGTPLCFQTGKGGGTNTTTWAHVTTAHSGTYGEQAQVSAYTSGGAVLVSSQDAGACAPSGTPGHFYTGSVWYQSDHPVFVETYYHDSLGWHFWKQSPAFAASSTWAQAKYTTPALPSGADMLSVGLEMTSLGTMTMDDFSLSDAAVSAPTVSMNAPADGATVSGTAVNLAANATAGQFSQIDHVAFLVDGQVAGSSSTPPYNVNWDSTSIADGSHTITAQAVDWAGNATTSAPVTVTVKNNTTPPTVALTSPTSGADLSGSAALGANASAAGTATIDHVDFLVDGNVVAASSTSPYRANWNSASLPDGPHTVAARAYDSSGNSTESSPASVTVDNTAPSSSASAPATAGNNTFTVAYTASDVTSGLALVKLYAKGPNDTSYSEAASNTTGANSSNFSYTASEGDGSYSFYTQATDNAGNVEPAHTTPDATTIVEATAPSSSAGSPAYANAGTWNVSFTASHPSSGIAAVDLYAKAPGESSFSKVASDTTGTSSGSFSYASSAGDGSYSFYTVAISNAGATESAPSAPDATTILDTAAPTSVANAPASAYRSPVTISYTASDSAGGSGLAEVDLYAQGPGESAFSKVASDKTPNASGSFSYSPNKGNGSYSFYTVALDTAGNAEAAPGSPDAATSYVLDTTAPSSKASSPASVTTTSWNVTYTASDDQGLASVELWVKPPNATSYSKAASNSGSSGSGSFSYTPTAGDGGYAMYTIAVDAAGNREAPPATADATSVLDTGPPSAFQMSDPGQYLSGSVSLSLSSAPTDSGSGVASVTYQYRPTGSTGSWSTACKSTAAPWSCTWSTATSSSPDGQYDLKAIATDGLANTTTASNAPLSGRTVDNTRPTAKSISTTNLAGAAKGKVEKGDTMTFTYSEAIKPGSILAGWTGASTAVQVQVSGKKNSNSTLVVWNSAGTIQLPLATPLDLGGVYTNSAVVTFNATMVQNGSAITVTLGTILNGTVAGSAATGGTITWTPSSGAADLAGNAATTTSVSAPGPAF